MKTKVTLTVGLLTGFLLGSKAGPKPWEIFSSGLRRLRHTRLVSRPIEHVADSVSGAVRRRGVAMSDRAADAVRRTIVGERPVLIEATVTEYPVAD